MSLPIFAPPIAPSPGTRRRPEVKTLLAEFGDGYTQEVGDGINNVRQVYSLKWDALLPSQADQIEQFLFDRKGFEPFLWKPSNSTRTVRVTCKEWERTDDTLHSIAATFRQSFVLDT